MSGDAIAEIRARAEAATEGPWQALDTASRDKIVGVPSGSGYIGIARALQNAQRDNIRHEANAQFIAHARTDIPALLAEVERLTERAETAERHLSTAERGVMHDALRASVKVLPDTAREHGRDAAEVAREIAKSPKWWTGGPNYRASVDTLTDLITAALLSERAEAEKMRKALEPFADHAKDSAWLGSPNTDGVTVPLGWLRAARDALASPSPGGKEQADG